MSELQNAKTDLDDITSAKTESIENRGVVDKIAEKLKASSIGEFLDDGDIRKMTRAAVYQAFFKPTIVKSGSYNVPDKEQPPVVVSTVLDIFKDVVKMECQKAVMEYMSDPKNELCEIMRSFITPEVINDMMKHTIYSFIIKAMDNSVSMMSNPGNESFISGRMHYMEQNISKITNKLRG